MKDMRRHGKRTVRDWNIIISLVKSHPQREAWGLGGLLAFLISSCLAQQNYWGGSSRIFLRNMHKITSSSARINSHLQFVDYSMSLPIPESIPHTAYSPAWSALNPLYMQRNSKQFGIIGSIIERIFAYFEM
jgi:hypothetical protein